MCRSESRADRSPQRHHRRAAPAVCRPPATRSRGFRRACRGSGFAPQIQNRGTLGGNLANASPAGDTLPVLLAYDAVVVTDRRAIAIDQFFTGYRRTALQPDELIVAVRIPLGRHVAFRKVGTRAAQAISKVVMAVSRSPARVAIGSVAEGP